MTSTFPVPLAPNNLARHPVFWSAAEVKAWVEFCVQEFSLSPIAFDRFDINGKALMLLNRSDFMERAPRVGDVLYNAFTHLSMASISGSNYTFNASVKTPVFISRDLGSQREYLYSSSTSTIPNSAHPHSSPFIPILPHPTTPTKRHHHPGDGGMGGPSANEGCLRSEVTGLENVPVSILSPAATDKSFSDTESCHNYAVSPIKLRDSPIVDRLSETTSFASGVFPDEGEGHNDDLEVTSGVGEHKGDCRLLWEFIYQLLSQDQSEDLVCWENADALVFRINDPTGLADQWGSQKNRTNMTYEKLSRALRYYYKLNIIQKVPGKKLTYKFLQSPGKIRKGQRGAKPHSFRSPQRSSFSSCSDDNSLIKNVHTVTMATKEDAVAKKTTLASDVDRKSSSSDVDRKSSSVKDSLDTFSSSISSTILKNSPVMKMSEDDEEKKIISNHSKKQEIKPCCPSEKDSLENQKTDVNNTGDLQAMKYENYEQQIFQDDVIKQDCNIATHLQMSKIISSPIAMITSQDQNQSESASLLRYSEDVDDPEMNISMEESDFSEQLLSSDLKENFNDKEILSPGSTCFENELALKKPQDAEVKENFNLSSSHSAAMSDVFNVCGNELKTDVSSSISQYNISCIGTTSMSPYFHLDDISVSANCNQDVAKHLQSRHCTAHDGQLKYSKTLFLMSENQSPSLELELQKTSSPTFLSSPLSSSVIDQSNKNNNNTTLLVSQAFACLNKNLASPSPSVNQYHDLHPRELQQQQHNQDPSVSQRHHHIKPAHSRHHNFDYNHINSLFHSNSKPLNLIKGSTIDNKYNSDNNNNNNISMESPLFYRQYRNHFNDVDLSQPENIRSSNSHNKKYCEPSRVSSTSSNHHCASGPSSYVALSSPPFDIKMYRHEKTSTESILKSSVLNSFDIDNELTVGSGLNFKLNHPLNCSDLPEDLSVKKGAPV